MREQTLNPKQDEAHKNAHYRQLNFMTILHLAQAKQTVRVGVLYRKLPDGSGELFTFGKAI